MAVRSSLAALTALAFAGAGIADLSEKKAAGVVRQTIAQVIGSRGDVSIASVWANPITGWVTIGGLAVRAGSQQLYVGKIDLQPGFALPRLIESAQAAAVDEIAPTTPDASAPTGKASADDVSFSSGGTTTRIAHIEASGTSLDSKGLLQVLETSDAEPFASRLRRLTAASILISELKIDRSDPAGEVHWAGRQILLANVVKGRATAASIGPTSLAVRSGADAGNADVVGEDLKGIDLGGIAHALEATRAGESEPLRSLVDSWTANSIRYTDVTHGRAFTLATAKATSIMGRAPPPGLVGHFDALKGPNGGGAAGPFFADLAGSFAIGALDLTDGATAADAQSAVPTVTGHFDRFAVHRVDGAGPVGSIDLAGFEIRHLSFAGGDNDLAIASAHVGGLRWQPSASPDKIGQPLVDTVEVNAVALRRTPSGHDGTAARLFTLRHAALSSTAAPSGALPAKASSDFEGLVFDPSRDDATKPLADLGYTHVELAGRSENTYDAAARTFHLAGFDVGGAGLGSLHLAFDLANVGPDVASPISSVQQAALSAILFKDVALSIKNEGLIGRMLAQRAQMEGRSVPAERSVLESLVTDQLPTLIGNPPKLQPLEKAIAAFIADPKTLDLNIASPNPIGAADFVATGPQDILATLQIEASANR